MKEVMDLILWRRATQLFERLQPHFPDHGRLLDLGSGTGHNSVVIENRVGLCVTKLDVADMNVVGSPVVLYDGSEIPFCDHVFQGVLALFIMHYLPSPLEFLQEVKRVGNDRILIIQSVYENRIGLWVLKMREWLQGRGAFHVAKFMNFVPSGPCTMQPVHFYTHRELEDLFEQAGLRIAEHTRAPWVGCGVSRDLYVLGRR